MNLQEFDKLVLSSQPHPVFKLDWSNYKALDFANAFLPSVKGYKATALYMFDGGDLFANIKQVDRKVLPLSNNEKLITTIGYSYPKGVLASEKVNDIEPAKHELLVFMEVESNDKVNVKFKSGDNFKQFLKQQPNARSIDALYTTTIDFVQGHFNRELVQKSMLQYVLNTLEIQFSVAQQEVQFSLDGMLNDILLFDRYRPTVFIRKSQKEVFNESKETKPADNEIYIWLVSEDYIKYDTDFVFLRIGKKVGKDFNDRKITEKYLSQFILDVIRAELDLNPFDKDLISAKTSRFLNRASFQAAISDDLEKNPKEKELFEKSPNAYFGVKALTHYAKEIEQYTLLPNRWLSKDANYNPLLTEDIIDNAFLCGLINGMIASFKGIPEGLAFFWEISVDIEKQNEFIKSIKKLLEEENLIELLLKGAIDGYSNAKHPEETAYQFGKGVITVIEIILGIITFFEGGGVSSFINGTKNVLRYLKRFGKKGVENLRKLSKTEMRKLFDNLAKLGDNLDLDDLDWVTRNNKTGNLGGKTVTTRQLKALKRLLKEKYGVELITEGSRNFRGIFKPIGKFKTPKQLFEFMSKSRPRKVGIFDAKTKQMLLPKDTTEIVTFHELAHAKHWKTVGDDLYKAINKLDRETFVWEQIFKNKSQWTKLELEDALKYIDGIRIKDYGLKALNIKL